MGLENRDYLRDEAKRYGEDFGGGGGMAARLGGDAPGCKKIIIITAVSYTHLTLPTILLV